MVVEPQVETCRGCGVRLPPVDGVIHAYLGASAGCWALFEKVLEREYADAAYRGVHRTTVDAYAAQHPGDPQPQTIQSINLHLVGLHLVLDCGLQPAFATAIMQRLTAAKARLRWLEPPASLGDVTVFHVVDAPTPLEHAAMVLNWGRSVWHAWGPHHEEIVAWSTWARRAAT